MAKHKRTYTYSKGSVRLTCKCGWQGTKVPEAKVNTAKKEFAGHL